ncbi:MAG: 50S ribosomal protein L25 [bacterium]|nr:50S ribosomal protein L25 [bacterium]
MFILTAKVREGKESPTALRRKGFVPAVYYGKKEQSTPIAVDAASFKKVWKEAGESSIITLKTEKGEIDSLLYEVQADPVSGEPVHADFYAVDANTEIHANVPLEFTGVSPAVKDLGATLVKVLHEMEVKSLPRDLPPKIVVDISSLVDLESRITVADLKIPKGVTTTLHQADIVASLAAEREEEPEPVPEAIDLSAIEVEKKGKAEEEGEAPAEGAAPPPEKEKKEEKK